MSHDIVWSTAIFCVVCIAVAIPIQLYAGPGETCLDWLSGRNTSSYSAFDIENDRNVRGRSFSCDSAVKASDARQLVEDFRYGFLHNSLDHIERSVMFPLKIRIWNEDDSPKIRRLSIESPADWLAFKKDRLSATERALIACATLENLQIFKAQSGFAIGLGRVWFLPDDNGKHLVQEISVKPLDSELLLRMCLVETETQAGVRAFRETTK